MNTDFTLHTSSGFPFSVAHVHQGRVLFGESMSITGVKIALGFLREEPSVL